MVANKPVKWAGSAVVEIGWLSSGNQADVYKMMHVLPDISVRYRQDNRFFARSLKNIFVPGS